MVKLLAERAFAKINLFLRVTGRRADGYHELDSIFVPISLSDRVTIEVRPAPSSSVTLSCNVASLGDPQTNLATRAAREFMREFGVSAHVRIDLAKSIPAGAGLGGGSSDAGTVLRMLSSMMPQSSSDSHQRLGKIAIGLGADVPFFLNPKPSRVTGIGEGIETFENFPLRHLVVAVPPIEVPTAAVFKELRRGEWSGAASSKDIDEILRGTIARRYLVNDLEPAAMRLYPEIARLKALLKECGATACAMSGSGGSVFGLFAEADAASSAATVLRQLTSATSVFVVQTLFI